LRANRQHPYGVNTISFFYRKVEEVKEVEEVFTLLLLLILLFRLLRLRDKNNSEKNPENGGFFRHTA
jgi:hypothetical protein